MPNHRPKPSHPRRPPPPTVPATIPSTASAHRASSRAAAPHGTRACAERPSIAAAEAATILRCVSSCRAAAGRQRCTVPLPPPRLPLLAPVLLAALKKTKVLMLLLLIAAQFVRPGLQAPSHAPLGPAPPACMARVRMAIKVVCGWQGGKIARLHRQPTQLNVFMHITYNPCRSATKTVPCHRWHGTHTSSTQGHEKWHRPGDHRRSPAQLQ